MLLLGMTEEMHILFHFSLSKCLFSFNNSLHINEWLAFGFFFFCNLVLQQYFFFFVLMCVSFGSPRCQYDITYLKSDSVRGDKNHRQRSKRGQTTRLSWLWFIYSMFSCLAATSSVFCWLSLILICPFRAASCSGSHKAATQKTG